MNIQYLANHYLPGGVDINTVRLLALVQRPNRLPNLASTPNPRDSTQTLTDTAKSIHSGSLTSHVSPQEVPKWTARQCHSSPRASRREAKRLFSACPYHSRIRDAGSFRLISDPCEKPRFRSFLQAHPLVSKDIDRHLRESEIRRYSR